jgi:hypothetical protein|tara:strand:- start:737 stop:1318 length:582 start_codon:yes stop_codon:yes gene_type:complete
MLERTIHIDVAVLCKEYDELEQRCDDHIINLDEIFINKQIFQQLFYPHGEQFGLNRRIATDNSMQKYISMLPTHRTVDGVNFYLLEYILKHIESDLGVSRDFFSRESLIDVTKELSSINSLLDVNCCSLLTSLTWKNICEMVEQYKKSDNTHSCIKGQQPHLIPLLVISLIFKTPTKGVKNTIVKLHYRILDF